MCVKNKAMFLEDISTRRICGKTLDGKQIQTEWEEDVNRDWKGVKLRTLANHGLSEEDMEYIAIQHYREGDDTLYVTSHAAKRLKQRGGLNKQAILRMTLKAYNEGIRGISDYYQTQWFLQRLEAAPTDNYEYVIYGQLLYVFVEDTLVTVLHVPSKEQRTFTLDSKEYKRRRNAMRYQAG